MSNSRTIRKSDNRSRVNREAKSIFAKLLAAEDIRVVHSARVTTAMWSGRTRTLTLPIWKEMSGDIYDMLVCHEVGHVLFTPSEDSTATKSAQNRLAEGKRHLMESAFAFLNICEDARIEKKMKAKYPGSRRSFHRGYKWMIDSGVIQLPSNLNGLKFIDRVNMFFKLGSLYAAGIQFDSRERPLVDRLAEVTTFESMVDVAEAMYRLAQEQKKEEQPQPQGDSGEPQPSANGDEEPMEGSCNPSIPNDPDENSPKDTRSSDDDTDDGESADSTSGDGDSRGEASDGKTDRSKPKDKDESSDKNPDGKSSDSGDDDKSDSDKSNDKSESGDSTDDGSESGDSSSDGDADDDSSSDGDDGSGSDSDGDSDSDADGNSDSDDSTDTDDADAEKSAMGHEGGKGSPADDNSLVAPECPDTMSGLEEAIESLVDRNAAERTYVNVPEAILKNLIQDHKELHKAFASEMCYSYDDALPKAIKDLAKFEKEAKPVVNVLAKRFDMMKAADEHRRAMTAKTGRINPDRLAFYKLTEDIFLRQTHVPDGKNHGLVMFIDWSGSMSDNMGKTIKQLLNLVLFCRRIAIPFEVFSFTDHDSAKGPIQVHKEGDFTYGRLTLHNWLSGRMSAREFKRAMIHMMMLVRHFGPGGGYSSYYRRSSGRNAVHIPSRFTLGGTPLDDCIVAAMDIVPAFQKENDVQIVNTIFLTDGASGTSPIFGNGASYNDDIVVHDPVTRSDYRLSDFDDNRAGSSYYGNRQATAMLLSMLRDRTDSNVIGFYLLDKYSSSSYDRSTIASNMRGASQEVIDREWKRFQTHKFAVAESMGYSEYYLIPANLDAKSAGLADASAESFMTMSRSKRVNRVLLNRFVDLIAKNR